MQVEHYYGNSMEIPKPIIIDNSPKLVYCIICGNIFEIEINNWEEAKNCICPECLEEM